MSFQSSTGNDDRTLDLLNLFLPLFNYIHEQPCAEQFHDEVDEAIPDYYTIITNPIALCNISDKLHNGLYNDPWQIINDFWLMFNNCLHFNRKSTLVYSNCVQLIDIFKPEANALMKRLGYCCADHLYYEPKLKQCTMPKGCLIKVNDVYYRANNPTTEYLVCKNCFNNCKESIEISETNKIDKDLFEQLKNDVREYETFVECSKCTRIFHTVCALYRDCGDRFVCQNCNPNSRGTKYSAEMIPASELSAFIERQVNDALKLEDKNLPNIIIRDFVDEENKITYLPKMKERYNMVDSTTYTVRAIYAFTKINGDDVMFFGMHTQEFSPDIDGPNKGCVSITYLDSVTFYQPGHLRTKLYHQILLSYLDCVRRKGMKKAHLWVCPPEIGNDYIFHRHPVEQKLPKKDRLKLWYETVFQKGKEQSIVQKYEGIDVYYQHIQNICPKDIAYFDCDFWPGEIENLFLELEKEVNNRQNSSNKAFKKKTKKKKDKKRDSSIMFDLDNIDGEINNRLGKLLKKWGDDFIVVTLVDMSIKKEQSESQMTSDWKCEILETRDKFLPFCKDFNLEFSNLRRVKYATMRILNEIFRENKKYNFFCNNCRRKDIRVRHYCKRCLDFDLCEKCFDLIQHEHEMFREELPAQQVMSKDELSNLVAHVFTCIERDCSYKFCNRMKQIKSHIDGCKSMNCESCKSATAGFQNHTRLCQEKNCPVYTCIEKNKVQKPVAVLSPQMRKRVPLSTSTPISSEQFKKNIQAVRQKVNEIKSQNLSKEYKEESFKIFMMENPHLNSAYHFLKNSKTRTTEIKQQYQQPTFVKTHSFTQFAEIKKQFPRLPVIKTSENGVHPGTEFRPMQHHINVDSSTVPQYVHTNHFSVNYAFPIKRPTNSNHEGSEPKIARVEPVVKYVKIDNDTPKPVPLKINPSQQKCHNFVINANKSKPLIQITNVSQYHQSNISEQRSGIINLNKSSSSISKTSFTPQQSYKIITINPAKKRTDPDV